MTTESTTIDIPADAAEALTTTAQHEASEYLEVIEAFVIEDDEDFTYAAEALKEVKKNKRALEATRTDLTQDLTRALEKLRALFRPAIKTFTQAEKILKGKIAAATRKREAEHTAALADAGKSAMAGDAVGASDAMQRARGVQTMPDVEGVSLRTTWTYRVTDLSKVPLAFLTIDHDAVMAVVKRDKDETTIPGVEVYTETSVAARVK